MMKPKKILVVEDEAVIQALCKRLLNRMGYEPLLAGGLREATEKIESNGDLDMLVTDLKLPDGNGVEVIRRFQKRMGHSKVVVITGSHEQVITQEQLEVLGLSKSNILLKPFEMKEFESIIRRSLGDN